MPELTTPFSAVSLRRSVRLERKVGEKRRRTNAGQGRGAPKQRLVKGAYGGGRRVALARQRDRGREHAVGIESKVGGRESREASEEEPCAHQQHECERHRRDDEPRLHAMPPQSWRGSRRVFLKRRARSSAIESKQWNHREQDRGQDRDRSRESQDTHVNGDVSCRGKSRGHGRWHCGHEPLREEYSDGAAGDRQDRAFGEQELKQSSTARAERHADCKLPATRGRSAEYRGSRHWRMSRAGRVPRPRAGATVDAGADPTFPHGVAEP